MASKLKRIFLNPRVLVVIAAFLLAAYFTGLPLSLGREGVVIKSVEKDSPAYEAGLRSGDGSPETIISIDSAKVRDAVQYAALISGVAPNQTIMLETSKAFYRITAPEGDALEGIGLKVSNVPVSNLNLGLDLQGGARVMLKPETKLPGGDMELLIANMNRRLNIFGLSDVVVRPASDFAGDQFVIVEVAGASEDDVRQLIAKQGKFEAKISNGSVFTGDEIVDVCRSAQCSGIDPQYGCRQAGSASAEWGCTFYFTISLGEEAAQKQAAATANLTVVNDYLSEPLQLYLDDELVDELQIGSELRGNPVTAVRISGSGAGTSRKDATGAAIGNMKKLQTILITGSLPVKLEIVRTDSISPILGEKFLKNAIKVGLIAIIFVVAVLVIAYRKVQIAIPIMLTSLLEVFLLLGAAAIIGWAIDLASIAGIIAAVGTGVNDQIIITDEALKGRQARMLSWKEKFKSAFSVIFGAFFTLMMAMLPLLFIGAGMLRGFALTTIIGMLVGVFITRPAYAKVIEILMEKSYSQ